MLESIQAENNWPGQAQGEKHDAKDVADEDRFDPVHPLQLRNVQNRTEGQIAISSNEEAIDCVIRDEAVYFVDQLGGALVRNILAHGSQNHGYDAQKDERDNVDEYRSSCDQKQCRVVPRILKVQ